MPLLLNMKEICTTASPHRMDCVTFGADDYASAVVATRTRHGHELDFQEITVCSKWAACGVDSIWHGSKLAVTIHNNWKSNRDSLLNWGTCAGKQVVHPNQIDVV
jgi:citrate lyase beta subunit